MFCILTAAYRPERLAAGERVVEEIGEQCLAAGLHYIAAFDHFGRGSLEPWLGLMRSAVTDELGYRRATHVVFLPDDALLVPNFVEVWTKLIEANPEALICGLSNHDLAPEAAQRGARWYTTTDGFVGFAGTMPIAWLREYLAWREQHDLSKYPADASVNLWAITTGRLVHKPLPSPIQHDLSYESLDGNQWQNTAPEAKTLRSSQVWDAGADLRDVDWSGPIVCLPPTFSQQRWDVAWKLPLTAENLEAMYHADRGGPVSDTPHVYIAVPAYQPSELAQRASVRRTVADLEAHGIAVTYVETPGDSLVTRGRHCLVHEFLRSPATHLLQWDADVECLDPSAVRKMVQSGHDVVGGAYPWRDGSGRVVCNPLPDMVGNDGAGSVDIDLFNCMRVAEIGTGFMLTSRRCIVDLQVRHPELMYMADLSNWSGQPMWALFDVHLEPRPDGHRRYASEDWRFCTLAREAGYGVHVYYPPVFRHWGKTAHEGHLTKAWGMAAREQRSVLA